VGLARNQLPWSMNMATRRPVYKSQADEMADDRRRMMRAELAEALGRDVSRKLHLNGESRASQSQHQTSGNEPLLHNAAPADRKQLEVSDLRVPVAKPQHYKQQNVNDRMRSATATSPYARGKAMQPKAVPEMNRQDQLQPEARRRSGP
jgi:hypothetical protein